MTPLRTLLALAILTTALAGCIDGDDAPAPVGSTATNDTDLPMSTPDGRGQFAAFKETNRTESGLGGVDHRHDYWLGRDRVVVAEIDSGIIPFPLFPGEGYPTATAIADYQPQPPNLVYEGTATVEVLLNKASVLMIGAGPQHAAPHPAVNLRLHYITSKDAPGEWRDAGALTVGTPTLLPVAPDEVDMPHAVASLWVFRVFTEEPNGVDFNITITAVRGDDVVAWPGHPDFYAEKPVRVVYDADSQTAAFGASQFLLTGDDTTWNHPEKLVSYGTSQLDVFVNISRVDSPVEPTGFFLDFHNASVIPGIQTFDPGQNRVYDEASDGTTFHFVVPVDVGGMDSPYQTASRWGFRVLGEFRNDATGQLMRGCGPAFLTVGTSCFPYSIDYHLTILARGASTSIDAIDPNAAEGTP